MTRELEELAARCEAAEGANFELEQRIGEAIGLLGIGEGKVAPAYTTSLDAALMLVPPGWFIGKLSENSDRSRAFVSLHGKVTPIADGAGTTPALALCAAALRAQASALREPGDE